MVKLGVQSSRGWLNKLVCTDDDEFGELTGPEGN